jgi:DeoR/GlpR family transcriptional regulator of sugar metabolism
MKRNDMKMGEAPDETKSHSGPYERQQWIMDLLQQNNSVDLDDLRKFFNVSKMTIHRDLDELYNQGVIRKVRGGATILPSYLYETDIHYRLKRAIREKEAIARHAQSLVEPGQVIFLDDSSTARTLAPLLTIIRPLTIITNSPGILSMLKGERYINQICLGGEYNPRFDLYAGLVCENAISSLRANILFMSVSAISGGFCFHQDQEVVKVKQAMMKSSDRKILMVDSGKFGRVALHLLASLEAFDLILVDSGLDKKYITELQENHVNFEIIQ